MRIPKLLISSSFILFGFLLLSSCDKKDAILVNRRTATAERVEEIKEEQRAKEKKRTPQPAPIVHVPPTRAELQKRVTDANLNLSADDLSRLIDILANINLPDTARSYLIDILRHLNAQDDNRDDDQNYDRTYLIDILHCLNAQGDDRSLLIDILHRLNAQGDDRSYLIDILYHLNKLEDCSHLINVLHRLDGPHIDDRSLLIDILHRLNGPHIDDRSLLIDILHRSDTQNNKTYSHSRNFINIIDCIDDAHNAHPDDRSLLVNIGFVLKTIEFRDFILGSNASHADFTSLIPDLKAFKALSRPERRRQLLNKLGVRKAIQKPGVPEAIQDQD